MLLALVVYFSVCVGDSSVWVSDCVQIWKFSGRKFTAVIVWVVDLAQPFLNAFLKKMVLILVQAVAFDKDKSTVWLVFEKQDTLHF